MNRHVLCIALVTTLTACVQTQDEHSPAAQDLADLRASAETGAAEAQWILGGMYVTGLGVPQDAAEAVAWYRRAAEQGHTRAQYNLGGMYREGLGVPQDAAEAVAWYRRAAEQGNATAQSNLGGMYAEGLGVPQDAAEAVAWYRRAAEQGNATAQSNLGGMYDQGVGVSQNFAEAVAWYRRAAEQGDARAQYNLGGMYREGLGVPQDAAGTVAWYRRAAEQGHTRAQYNLGGMYAEGLGVPPDDVEANMWLTIAASRSTGAEREQIVTARAAVAARMTPTDLREANRRAQAWHAAHRGMRNPTSPPSDTGHDTGHEGLIIALELPFTGSDNPAGLVACTPRAALGGSNSAGTSASRSAGCVVNWRAPPARDRWKRRSERLKKQLARRGGPAADRHCQGPAARSRPASRTAGWRTLRSAGLPPAPETGRRRGAGADGVHCGGHVTRVASQYQEELPGAPPVRRIGMSHAETSDAGSAYSSATVGLVVDRVGVPLAKVAKRSCGCSTAPPATPRRRYQELCGPQRAGRHPGRDRLALSAAGGGQPRGAADTSICPGRGFDDDGAGDRLRRRARAAVAAG